MYKKNDKIIVKFFTFSAHGIISIFEHYDIYPLDSYVFDTKKIRIAEGGGGYNF